MRARRKKLWLVTMLAMGAIVYFADDVGYKLPQFVGFYLNDLLIVPITGLIVTLTMQAIFKVAAIRLHAWEVGYIVLFYTILFEGVLPLYVQRYTSDWLDVVMYGMGGLIYFFKFND